MDLVEVTAKKFSIQLKDYLEIAERLELKTLIFSLFLHFNGDNIVEPSHHMPWYKGSPLLEFLET